jgi:hypothetical protein
MTEAPHLLGLFTMPPSAHPFCRVIQRSEIRDQRSEMISGLALSGLALSACCLEDILISEF